MLVVYLGLIAYHKGRGGYRARDIPKFRFNYPELRCRPRRASR